MLDTSATPIASRWTETIESGAASRPVSVCHILSGDRWAGLEVQAVTQITALARRDDVRVSAIVLNPGRVAEEIRSSGTEVVLVPEKENSFTRILWKATRELSGAGVDVLHAHRYKENFLSALLARRCRIPHLVRTQHGRPEKYFGMDWAKSVVAHSVDRLASRYAADCVIGVSGELRTYLETYLPARKIAIVANGLNLEQVVSGLTPVEAKTRLGIPARSPVIGNVGRIDAIKRPDLFVETSREILASLPEAHFVMAGEGKLLEATRRQIESLGLGARIHLLGPRSDPFDVLRALDLMLIASDQEGLPMVLLEAMALRVPVVSRRVGGIPEVIQHEVHGVLVNGDTPQALAQACVQALADSTRLAAMRNAAYSRVSREYSAESNAGAIVAVYRSLLRR